jgi:uncharacterized protein (TIGR00299 family) protein
LFGGFQHAKQKSEESRMRVAYFDAFSGVSGDMTVAALLSLGVPWQELQAVLAALPLSGYELRSFTRKLHGIEARCFEVVVASHHAAHAHEHRHWREVRSLLEEARLPHGVRNRALQVFEKLAQAESKVHGVPPEEVAFHEVGAVDSIVDIVAASFGFEFLEVERAYVSELPLGRGLVHGQHGPLPVPGPATLELLRGFRVRFEDGAHELVTPTGAALVAAFGRPQPPPALRPLAIGYGAGQRDLADRPNVLRLVLAEEWQGARQEEMVVVETNLDDLSPQWFDWVMSRLFAAGARDVWVAPVQMKKSRPGFVLSALADPAGAAAVAETMLEETPTLGVRTYLVRRHVLPREERVLSTRFGDLRIKIARTPQGRQRAVPEYEDCRRAASEAGVPLSEVYAEALAAIRQQVPEKGRDES